MNKLEPLPEALQNSYDKDSLIYCNDDLMYYNVDFDKDLLYDITHKMYQIYNGTYRYNYEDTSTTIFLNGRGRNCGKKIFKIEGFYPYLYDYAEEGKYKTYLGDKVEKIVFFQEPRRVADYRRLKERSGERQPCEADILLVRRMLIDTYDFFKPTEYVEPKVCIVDLETNFPVNNNIISFAINGYDGFLYYNSINDTDKYRMILDCYTKMLDYDIVANWNVEFDINAIQAKLQKMQVMFRPLKEEYIVSKEDYIRIISIDYNVFGIVTATNMFDALEEYGFIKVEDNIVKYGDKEFNTDLNFLITPVDLLPITKKMYVKEINGRWTLDNTGIKLCGIGKVDYDARYVRDLDPELLKEYNIRDVIIPEIIDNHLGGIQCHTILAWSLQCLFNDTIITAVVNDISLLRAYHKDGIVLPSRPPYDRFKSKKKNNEYGYTAAEPDARPGVYKDTSSADLHAAYGTAVIAINASPETKDKNGKYIAPNGIRFNDGYSTFIEELKRLMKDRRDVKSKMNSLSKGSPEWRKYKFIDFALKTSVAAFSHGIFGWDNSRMRDVEVADAITSTVRCVLDTIKEYLDNNNHQWIYCHTDGILFEATKEEAEKTVKELNVVIKEYCKKKGYSVIPDLEYKGYYKQSYIHSPARNVLVKEDGEWEVKGMSHIRSDTTKPLGDIEIELITMKLDNKPDGEMISKLREMVEKVKKMDSREIALFKPLSKPIKKYGKIGKDGVKGSIPYHVKALQRAMNDYGYKIKVGEKFCLLPIVLDEFTGVRVIKRKTGWVAFDPDEGLPDMYTVDWISYFRSNLFGKIHRLFNCSPKELENKIMLVCNE